MPAANMSKDQVLAHLMAAFRARGFDATSLADIAAATGLGKSSLYHHFPGGKGQMAKDVLDHLAATLRRDVYEPLRTVSPARRRLDQLLDAIDAFYRQGRDACLLERLCASTEAESLSGALRRSFRDLLGAFEGVARDAGVPAAEARARAEDAVVRIEGALVVSAGLGETKPFERAIGALRRDFLAPSHH